MITQTTETFAEIGAPTNPFPGLRPFEFDESHLFFGRDGQSEQLIGKLARTRFLAVVGSSGSGKSSLVRAGLLPALLGGFMTTAGSDWRIAILRPGNDPIGNLARALNAPDVFGSDIDENAGIQTAIAEANLRRGSRGLVEAVRQNAMPDNENLLVLVDQFEELFRFAREASRKTRDESERYQNDAAAFVKLLLEAHSQREANIYVVLTMRSDFLGDCAQFWDLPETVNESQYLTPRLTRDQLREAITGPVAVGGGEITPRLVNRLLNDVGDSQDQLPVLQHLLMRAWDEWKEKRLEVEVEEGEGTVRRPHKEVHQGEAIDLCCYEAVGGMAEALSRHADEAFNELPDDRHREVAEKLFKALTEKGPDNREIRRPIMLGEICAVTLAPLTEVVLVVDTFRLPGRSFLMPPANVALNSESLIDISHESLIRGWERLRNWVEEEARSARIYRRLAETAELHREGRAGLWGDPDLQLAVDWQEKNHPNKDWARRYYPGFETAIAFLQASEKKRATDTDERQRQQQAEIERAKRELEQARALAEAQQQRAEAQRQQAEEQQQRLEQQARATSRLRRLLAAFVVAALLAAVTAVLAIGAYQRAETANSVAIREKEKAEEAAWETEQQRRIAVKAREDAIISQGKAEEAAKDAVEQKGIAQKQKGEADQAKIIAVDQRVKAEKNLHEANDQRQIALARQLGAQADLMRDEPQMLSRFRRLLLATDAMKRLRTVEAESLEVDLALRQGLASLPRHIARVSMEYWHDDVQLSPDGRNLIVGNFDSMNARVVEVATGKKLVRIEGGAGAFTVTIAGKESVRCQMEMAGRANHKMSAFSGDGKYVVTEADVGTEGVAQVWETDTGAKLLRLQLPGRHHYVLSADGRYLAVSTEIWDRATNTYSEPITRVWDVRAGEIPGSVPGYVQAFSQDATVVATSRGVWEVTAEHKELFSPELDMSNVVLTSDGGHVAIWTERAGQRQIEVWSRASKTTASVPTPGSDGQLLAVTPDGRFVILRDNDRDEVQVYDIEAKEIVSRATLNVRAAVVLPSGQHLVASLHQYESERENVVDVWELRREGGDALAIDQRDKVVAVGLTPLGGLTTIAQKGETLIIRAWDVKTGREIPERMAQVMGRNAVFAPDGQSFAVITDSGLEVRRVDDPEPVAKFGSASSAVWSPAGQYLGAQKDREVRVWDLRSRQIVGQLTLPERATVFALARGGDFLVARVSTGGRGTRLPETESMKAWRVANGEELKSFEPDMGSTDGRYRATSGKGMVILTETKSGREAFRVPTNDRPLTLDQEGRYLATISDSNTVRVWFLRQDDLIEEACRRLFRNLSKEEWDRYLGADAYRKTCPKLP